MSDDDDAFFDQGGDFDDYEEDADYDDLGFTDIHRDKDSQILGTTPTVNYMQSSTPQTPNALIANNKNAFVNDASLPFEASSHTIADLWQRQYALVQQCCQILGVSACAAVLLLQSCKWHHEKLLETYVDESDRVRRKAGLPVTANGVPVLENTTMQDEAVSFIEKGQVSFLDAQGHRDCGLVIERNRKSPFFCQICCETFDSVQIAVLIGCEHSFCQDCYRQYVVQRIVGEGEVRRIACAAPKCPQSLDMETVRRLVDSVTYEKYRSLLLKAFVDDCDYLKWCPAPSCEAVVECRIASSAQLRSAIPIVQCLQQHRFCFGCLMEDHRPAPCAIYKAWMKKCADDSETSSWIAVHTKECPKCKSTIEKNGGCNHITCRKCKHEFCWVCHGPWSEHGTQWYECNRYDEKSSADARDLQSKSRASLDRYLHYYNRYINHERSAKLEKDLIVKTEAKMEQMQASTELSWIEVQFFRRAVNVLVACRTTLKYTYAFAFYLQRHNQTELFEDNQRDLELAVENLSELLERPVVPDEMLKLKQTVLDKTVYVESRRQVLLLDAARGLSEDRWLFLIDI